MSCPVGYRRNAQGRCQKTIRRSYEKNFIGPQRAPSGNVPRSARNGQCPRGYNRNHTTGQCTRGRYSLDVSGGPSGYIPYPKYISKRSTRRSSSKRKRTKRKSKFARCPVGYRRVGSRCRRTY